MSSHIWCDVCGEAITGNYFKGTAKEAIIYNKTYHDIPIDICQKCMERIEARNKAKARKSKEKKNGEER